MKMKPAPSVPEVPSGKGGGGGAANPASIANLTGVGKPGRGHRKGEKEFLRYCEELLEEADVQDALRNVLTDPSNRGYSSTLKTVATLARKMPAQAPAALGAPTFIIFAPPKAADPEQWLRDYGPDYLARVQAEQQRARLTAATPAEVREAAGAGGDEA